MLPSEEQFRERFKKEREAKRGGSPSPPNGPGSQSPRLEQPSADDRYGNYLKQDIAFATTRPHKLDRPTLMEERYERSCLLSFH